MSKITSHILDIDRLICKNIEMLSSEDRGVLSQNILAQLRNMVEHISLKVLEDVQKKELNNDYETIKEAIEYIKIRGDLKFLSRFHKLLQISVSHYTLNEESSERLLLKYYEYLIRIKSFLKVEYNLDVLYNLLDFPIQTDSNLKQYYEKISILINKPIDTVRINNYKDRYYIHKIKPFDINDEIYYEVTFSRANDYTSKFDRIIAFTKEEILGNYAVKLSISIGSLDILGEKMPIQIIENWEASIRPCEIRNMGKILGLEVKVGSNNNEYKELMSYLSSSGLDLIEVIDLNNFYYNYVKGLVTKRTKISRIFNLLDNCRKISKSNSEGYNVIRYLLLRLNNKVIKNQYNRNPCKMLSNLYLNFGCIPFDQMPLNSGLINHNPKFKDLLLCINFKYRKHELLARYLKNNTEVKGHLYTAINDIKNFKDIEKLVDKWNNNIYSKHEARKIESYKNHLFIKGYELDTYNIIREIKKSSLEGIKNYKNSIESWLKSTSYNIDCDEKKLALKNLFENSKVALIYGAAGTGKSTMINHISNFFDKENKLYLANTNPAVDNLKRNIRVANCTFKTVNKFFWSQETEYDILIVDECSTVSNSDMFKVLKRAKFRLLVLVGDVYQIESILFGNWFSIIKSFIPTSSVFELEKPYRANNKDLLRLWSRVRNMEDNVLETLTKYNYTRKLDNSIFHNSEEDEIILCLNYDGLYGINNINLFLQSSNSNKSYVWGIHSYKVNDPIIFNESGRFSPLIYNNLKGKISRIELLDNQIQFDIEVNLVLNEFDIEKYEFELLDNAESGNSVIRFKVDKYKSTDDDDDDLRSIIPFQVAYAVSIHKAQGLEYNSVKIVITDEVEENISHNIFYTAITRAKENLNIYWTPESENKVLGNFKSHFNKKDFSLLKLKYEL